MIGHAVVIGLTKIVITPAGDALLMVRAGMRGAIATAHDIACRAREATATAREQFHVARALRRDAEEQIRRARGYSERVAGWWSRRRRRRD